MPGPDLYARLSAAVVGRYVMRPEVAATPFAVILLSIAGALSAVAAQDVRTTTRIRIREGPSIADSILRVLPKNAGAVLLAPDGSGGFFHIRTPAGLEGWVHGHYLVPTGADSGAATLIDAASGHGYPVCGGKHFYRWAVKKDHTGIPATATSVTVTAVLGWAAADVGRDLGSWCADRGGRELRAFALTGWVRRIKKDEADADWHIELTAARTSPVTSCVIVEIPDQSFGAEYGTARDRLDQLTTSSTHDSHGDLSPPVRVRFVGAAFYDGWHRTSHDHGRCNSTAGAIWELHPVFQVVEP